MNVVLQPIIHYSLHFLFPGLVAWFFFRENWKKAWCIMLATMLVDADHLLTDPIFMADRCSIGFHPLHGYVAISGYFVLLFFKRTRIVAVGLLLHMMTDFVDCSWQDFID